MLARSLRASLSGASPNDGSGVTSAGSKAQSRILDTTWMVLSIIPGAEFQAVCGYHFATNDGALISSVVLHLSDDEARISVSPPAVTLV